MLVYKRNVHYLQEIRVGESISGDKVRTRSRINALIAHGQTLLSCLKHTALDRLRVRLNAILFFKVFSIHSLPVSFILQTFLLNCCRTSSLCDLSYTRGRITHCDPSIGPNLATKGSREVESNSSSAMAKRPRKLGDFKKARVNGGTNSHSLKDSHKCLRCR